MSAKMLDMEKGPSVQMRSRRFSANAWVEEIPGVNTQGESLDEARKLEGRAPHGFAG
jgi:hypothetical protein